MSKPSQDAYHKIPTTPPAKPAGCPVDHEFTPFDPDYLRNPYPQLERLSAEQPVFYSEKLGYLVITRIEHLREVFRQPDIYSSENVQDPVFPVWGLSRSMLIFSERRLAGSF